MFRYIDIPVPVFYDGYNIMTTFAAAIKNSSERKSTMLVILSPARNIRPDNQCNLAVERPLFPEQAGRLATILSRCDPWELESLLDLNPERALDMSVCYRQFDIEAPGTPALLSYYGAAFQNMKPGDFTPEEHAFAQEHLRILSTFYGLVRPWDGILPHRLGLDKRFRVDGGDLYAYWGRRVASGRPVIGLASQDYTRLVSPFLTRRDTLITCRFLIQKPGGARGTVSTVRAARGQMARFIVKNRIENPEELRRFDWDGYRFIEGRSDADTYVFIRA